ncbi:NADH-cytochrome b5 reductase-like [Nomascus leucogenys]|uniref:NADH-cytochrome b5 reductase-like n=1 Tax=Nomascus leucogenys TaxID=61853 RepID=UPI00122D8CAA|nr:NADH-cytochrome b5 reductase-like [Nomascus leucogenys]
MMTLRKPGCSCGPRNPCPPSAAAVAARPVCLTSITETWQGGRQPEPARTGACCVGQSHRGIVDDLEIQRAYTPISPANAEGYFEVLIKCYQMGLMSRYVESWRVGDTAFWRRPFGDFFHKPNQYGELLMLAAGTGLAPMVPILQSIIDNEKDETFVTLVGCFKTFESIYLKTFLQEQARFWNVCTFFILSQESSSEQLPWSYQEKTRFGHLGQDLIKELVSCCRRKPFALVCGSAEFTKDIARCLLCTGLTENSYFLF